MAFGVIRAVSSMKAAGTIADRGPVGHSDVTTDAVHEVILRPAHCRNGVPHILVVHDCSVGYGADVQQPCCTHAAHIVHTLASEGELIET